MPITILMPALSPTMEVGTLAKWLVKEGDSVAPGDVIAEIETDKATMEVEAVDEGVLGKILVAEGTEGVKVNTPIAVLLQDGEDASAAPPPAAAAPTAEPAAEGAEASEASGQDGECSANDGQGPIAAWRLRSARPVRRHSHRPDRGPVRRFR